MQSLESTIRLAPILRSIVFTAGLQLELGSGHLSYPIQPGMIQGQEGIIIYIYADLARTSAFVRYS